MFSFQLTLLPCAFLDGLAITQIRVLSLSPFSLLARSHCISCGDTHTHTQHINNFSVFVIAVIFACAGTTNFPSFFLLLGITCELQIQLYLFYEFIFSAIPVDSSHTHSHTHTPNIIPQLWPFGVFSLFSLIAVQPDPTMGWQNISYD